MTDHSMVLSDRNIRLLLAKRKTESRRAVKPQPEQISEAWAGVFHDGTRHTVPAHLVAERLAVYACKFRVGDRIWVKEDCHAAWQKPYPGSWAMIGEVYQANGWPRMATKERPIHVWYKVDLDRNPFNKPWTLAPFTPRWASRITLTVTGVRAHRLQDMSEADFKGEGAEPPTFVEHWDDINASGDGGVYAWAANPWVFAITFGVRVMNIDEEGATPCLM
jgi:hypothetical protein